MDSEDYIESRNICLNGNEDILTLILIQLGYIDYKCLILNVPLVCKYWRDLCKYKVFKYNVNIGIYINMKKQDIKNIKSFIEMYKLSIIDRYIYIKENKLKLHNEITDKQIPIISEIFSYLTEISLFCCKLITMESLVNDSIYNKLKSIQLSLCNNLTDIGFQNLITKSPNLNSLCIYNSAKLTDSSFNLVSNCHKLTYLNFGGLINISIECIKHILNNCNNIIHFISGQDNINNEILELIGNKYLNLKTLVCSGETNITDNGILNISNCHKLEILSIASSLISDDGIDIICKNCPNIIDLSLIFCSRLTHITSNLIGEYYPNLKKLCLMSTRNLKNINNILINCPKLLNLNIHNCNININFCEIINNCGYLEYFEFGHNNINYGILDNINTPYTNLKYLDVSQSMITDDILKDIIKHSPLLETISIEYCNELTKVEMVKIIKQYPNIEFIGSYNYINAINYSEIVD